MSPLRSFLRRAPSAVLLGMGLAFFAWAALLLHGHVRLLQTLRESVLPAAVRIPQIERRIAALAEQVEISEIQASLRGGSDQELLKLYVLPTEPGRDRLIATFEALSAWLDAQGLLVELSAIDMGAVEPGEAGLSTFPVSFGAELTPDGAKSMLAFLDLAGFLTVGDALSPDEVRELLRLTEEENPAGVTALEHFLATDLLRYAQEPKPYEDQLLKSFTSPAFEASFRAVVRASRLEDVRAVLGGDLGRRLDGEKLWPVRFLSVESSLLTVLPGGRVRLEVAATAYVRGE